MHAPSSMGVVILQNQPRHRKILQGWGVLQQQLEELIVQHLVGVELPQGVHAGTEDV